MEPDDAGADIARPSAIDRGVTEAGAASCIVEDDETPAPDLVARHLRAHGYDVDEAASAEEAAQRARRRAPARLVLLDINLPGDTGWDAPPRRRARGRRLARRSSSPARRRSARRASREFGVAGYLPKPFPLETLRRRRSSGCSTRRSRTNHDRPADPRDRVGCRRRLRRLPASLCDRVAPMNAHRRRSPALAAAFVFVYLLWALLRPEDF